MFGVFKKWHIVFYYNISILFFYSLHKKQIRIDENRFSNIANQKNKEEPRRWLD